MDGGEFVDREVARYRREMAAAVRRLMAEVRAALKQAERDGGKLNGAAANVELARRLGDELARELGAELRDLQREWRAAVDDLVAVVGRELADAGIGAEFYKQGEIGKLMQRGEGKRTLAYVLAQATEGLKEERSAVRPALREAVVRMMREPHAPTVVQREIAAELGGSMGRALSLVDTSLAGVDRAATVAVGVEVGAEWFLYDGPMDAITRPWCAARVGRRFKLAQIDARENRNDTGPQPVSLFGGGYGCRHRWVPLQGEDALKQWPAWRG